MSENVNTNRPDFTINPTETIGGGLEKKILLVELENIDKTAITTDPYLAGGLDGMVLRTPAEAIFVEGIGQENSTTVAIGASEVGRNGSIHTLVLAISSPTKVQLGYLNKLQSFKMRMCAVVEKVKKGDGTFQVLGFDNGMIITDIAQSSKENGGVYTVTMASNALAFERGLPLYLGATKDAFESKFATV